MKRLEVEIQKYKKRNLYNFNLYGSEKGFSILPDIRY